jgi:hypothetical protein
MRTGHNKQRNRNRHRSGGGGGGGGNGGGNPLSRVYESNGPDVKVRGTAQTIADKYLQLGRDAQVSGDNVTAESYYQFAEHYLRIVAAAQAYNQQMQQQYRRPEDEQDDEGDEDGAEGAAQPRAADQGQPEQPREGEAERQGQQGSRPPRDQRDDRGNRDNRDRNRQRFQDRRDGQQQGNGGFQPRGQEAQPREAAPAARPDSEVDQGQWEAPSFLRRPAPLPATEAAAETPDETAAASPAAERKPRRPYTRREKPAEVDEGRTAETAAEPAAD